MRKNKLYFIKIKNICVLKEIIKKVERQSTEWEKAFANRISNKSPMSTILKEFINPLQQKDNPILKKGLESLFLQRCTNDQ